MLFTLIDENVIVDVLIFDVFFCVGGDGDGTSYFSKILFLEVLRKAQL